MNKTGAYLNLSWYTKAFVLFQAWEYDAVKTPFIAPLTEKMFIPVKNSNFTLDRL